MQKYGAFLLTSMKECPQVAEYGVSANLYAAQAVSFGTAFKQASKDFLGNKNFNGKIVLRQYRQRSLLLVAVKNHALEKLLMHIELASLFSEQVERHDEILVCKPKHFYFFKIIFGYIIRQRTRHNLWI